jgi:hypothetical protein
VVDLLRPGQRVGTNKVAAQRYVLEGRADVQVGSFQEVAGGETRRDG